MLFRSFEVQTWRGISSTDKHLVQNHIILAVKFLSCAVKFLSHAVNFLSHAVNFLSHAVKFRSHAVNFRSYANFFSAAFEVKILKY